MKISEYIAQLSVIQLEHGDLECESFNYHGERFTARDPCVAFKKVLRGRESKSSFYEEYTKDETRRGEKVCRL